jgi:hypothetical protein
MYICAYQSIHKYSTSYCRRALLRTVLLLVSLFTIDVLPYCILLALAHYTAGRTNNDSNTCNTHSAGSKTTERTQKVLLLYVYVRV